LVGGFFFTTEKKPNFLFFLICKFIGLPFRKPGPGLEKKAKEVKPNRNGQPVKYTKNLSPSIEFNWWEGFECNPPKIYLSMGRGIFNE